MLRRNRKTHEYFVNEIYSLVGNEYEVLDTYINAVTKIKIKHTACSTIYEVTPNNFLNGKRCPRCNSGIRNQEEFVQKVTELTENEYTVIGKYKSSHTKLEIKHNICESTYEVAPNTFLNGHRCAVCFGNQKKNTEIFKDEVFKLVENDYIVLGEYQNTHTKIKMKHNVCGRTFYVDPNNFLRGQRCSKCRQPKGEKRILEWLDINKIKYIQQFRFNDCRNRRALAFDFAIFDDENRLICLIEYDGEQHFKPMKFYKDEWRNVEKLKTSQLHDEIKNTYCENNNIKLIRISYLDFDKIENILYSKLTNQGGHIHCSH